jgi:L-lactate dehydrogenase complex protein LldG
MDSSSDEARKRILQRIRRAQGRSSSPSQAELEHVQTYIEARRRGPIPELGGDLIAQFRDRAEGLSSTVEVVEQAGEAPAAAARYLERHGLPTRGCVWPALSALGWRGAGLDLAPRNASGDDALGVTGAFAALAETGTLMVVSGSATPGTVSLLPETHIAIVRASRLVATMEDAWVMARAAFGQLPRAVNFISGPSRTADIEQQMILGAHGPRRVHIIIIRSM